MTDMAKYQACASVRTPIYVCIRGQSAVHNNVNQSDALKSVSSIAHLIKVLHWWAWVASKNQYWSYKVERAGPEEAMHVKILWAGCGREEPGSTMRVKLAQ